MSTPALDVDPDRYPVEYVEVRGVRLAYTRVGPRGTGVPLVLVHGWPESRRIWWRVLEPLAAAGFDVLAPDLRGFGDSAPGPDGRHDVVAFSLDLLALLDEFGLGRGPDVGGREVVLCGGDLGGPIIGDLAARRPGLFRRMVLFNAPLPFLRDEMAGLRTRPDAEHLDYFVRQGTDADALAAELATAEARRAYIARFYTDRGWAHPGAFTADEVAFHTAPFADATRLRAGFGVYESVFDAGRRTDTPLLGRNPNVRTTILFGPSDHVVAPDFDRLAAVVYPDHVGPYRLRDCGHFVPWEAPGALVSTLVANSGDLLTAAR